MKNILYVCAECYTPVTYYEGTGRYTQGASESFEVLNFINHKKCPKCGSLDYIDKEEKRKRKREKKKNKE